MQSLRRYSGRRGPLILHEDETRIAQPGIASASLWPLCTLQLDNARSRRIGSGVVTCAALFLSGIDGCAKRLVQGLPVVEVVWPRFATHAALMSALGASCCWHGSRWCNGLRLAGRRRRP